MPRSAGSSASGSRRPAADTAGELRARQQTDAWRPRRPRSRLRRVVTPRGEEESHPAEARIARGTAHDALQRFQPVFDERELAVAGSRIGEQLDEVVALVLAALLAVHLVDRHVPALENATRELAFLRRDDDGTRRCRHDLS